MNDHTPQSLPDVRPELLALYGNFTDGHLTKREFLEQAEFLTPGSVSTRLVMEQLGHLTRIE